MLPAAVSKVPAAMTFWADHVLPFLVEKTCRSPEALEERKRWVLRAHGHVLELGVGPV